MRLNKKGPIILLAVILMFTLAGCTSSYTKNPTPINATSGGFWDHYFVFPMSWFLDESALMLAGSYGFAIILTTVVIRLAVLPLMVKQIKNSKAMQALQPELQKLKEKHKNDPKKVQEETMKLFQKNNVNPLSGCLPLLVQMPFLIAFYQAIIRNPSIHSHTFLWMSLGKPDQFYILPILAAATTFLQQKVMGTGTPQNNPQTKMMFVIMPIMILVIAVSYPSALSLYWVFGNVVTILQSFFIKGHTLVPAQEGKSK